ncbi:hypothetical protein DNU06_14055 [Putridiphycobacter roseus]|uniref:DUF3012 domain-containing protein n=1 Tax=Putridiphycobacter roseus TaxID=2219161 RepID=A0A2W1NNR5_9FLAO|nr:hypothetical protein [Putridiphycobacter roseus]PZE16248.1 hypothetical protein DNU06_14055 [Putridiphycobacter roseus]
MKKVILIAAVSMLALASCKKDYTCECTIDSEVYTYELKDVKKSDAKDACDAVGASWILAGGSCDFN